MSRVMSGALVERRADASEERSDSRECGYRTARQAVLSLMRRALNSSCGGAESESVTLCTGHALHSNVVVLKARLRPV